MLSHNYFPHIPRSKIERGILCNSLRVNNLATSPTGRSPPSFTISAPSVVPPWLDSRTPYLPDSPPNAFAAPPRCDGLRKIGHPKAEGRPIGHKRLRRTSLPPLPGRRIRPAAWSEPRPEPGRTPRTSSGRWRCHRSGSSGWWSSGTTRPAGHGHGAR